MRNCSTYQIIKAAKPWIALFLLFTAPPIACAESGIQGEVVNTPARIANSANIAEGGDNKAVQSSISLKNARVDGNVVNSGQSRTVVTAAVGRQNQATESTAVIKNSRANGTLTNSSVADSTVNLAVGTDNKADQGSVRIENARIRGTMANTAVMTKSANMAVGKNNSASQAAIVMGGTQLPGRVVNNATSGSAVNAAAGYGNEANQAAVVVDGAQAGSGAAAAMPQNSFQADPGQGEPSTPVLSERKQAQEAKERRAAPHVPGQVVFLVGNNKAGIASLDRVAKKYRLDVGEKTVLKTLDRIMVVCATGKDAGEIAQALHKEPGIHNPQPNYVFATMGEKDPLSHMQNLVSMLDLQEVHSKVSGKNITVAVVDTGVEVEHEDLRSRIVGYQNFISDSVYQGEIHGTAVAGIIGADKNDHGIVGIAPEVSLLALRACRQVGRMSAAGECFSTSLVRSLDAAISAKVDVVNLSLGAYVKDTLLGMMIDSGHEKGIVFAAPVGNDPAAEEIAFPASHDKVISVAGLDELGNPLPNRRLAAKAAAVAPATHLFVTAPGNSYNFIDGTSLASASISGIIALSLEKKRWRNSPCLPRNSAVPWPRQVYGCLGL